MSHRTSNNLFQGLKLSINFHLLLMVYHLKGSLYLYTSSVKFHVCSHILALSDSRPAYSNNLC